MSEQYCGVPRTTMILWDQKQQMSSEDLAPLSLFTPWGLEGVRDPRIRAVVKGNQFQVTAFAYARGIPCTVAREWDNGDVPNDPRHKVTSITVPAWAEPILQKWYLEDQGSQPPFAIGSVLFYASMEHRR